MMKYELERTLGEFVSEETFQLLQAIYNSDAAPSLGGEEGRQYLKKYLAKNRVQIAAMAEILRGERGHGMAVEEELGAARRGLDTLNKTVDALRADVVSYMNEGGVLREAKRAAEDAVRAQQWELEAAVAEKNRLQAAQETLAKTLRLMGLNVENIARLAAGVAAYDSMASECENALTSDGRWAMEVASTLTYDFTKSERVRKEYEAEAEARALDAQARKVLEMAGVQVTT